MRIHIHIRIYELLGIANAVMFYKQPLPPGQLYSAAWPTLPCRGPQVHMNPVMEVSDLPLKAFYRYALPTFAGSPGAAVCMQHMLLQIRFWVVRG